MHELRFALLNFKMICFSLASVTKSPLTRISTKYPCFTTGLKHSTVINRCTKEEASIDEVVCVGTGTEVECLLDEKVVVAQGELVEAPDSSSNLLSKTSDLLVLISPFFFWGTSMVVMKLAAPHTTPLLVGFIRLFPAGVALLFWAMSQNRPLPSTSQAWIAISLFGLIDGACFQGFLAEGLQRTSAGLGSIIIDSQPLTVAVLAALFYNERFTLGTSVGLGLGILGLSCLQLPTDFLQVGLQLDQGLSLWDRGEWWMLLAAQSMAIGTVMVRWVSKYSDPVMATAWHMIIGSIPLLIICLTTESNALIPRLAEFNFYDILDLTYVTLLGSAASYGVFFYNASKGNLTALSSLTFLTPVFATITGFLVLNERLTPLQILGGAITLTAVFLISSTKRESK